MNPIMEKLINEEKIEQAKRAIQRGKLSLEDIAETIGLVDGIRTLFLRWWMAVIIHKVGFIKCSSGY